MPVIVSMLSGVVVKLNYSEKQKETDSGGTFPLGQYRMAWVRLIEAFPLTKGVQSVLNKAIVARRGTYEILTI